MARKIHNYKNLSDFSKDYYSETDYSEPWVSNVKRKNRWSKYDVIYNKSEGQVSPPSILWLDDFPDGTDEGYSSYEEDWMYYKYGDEYDTFEMYLDDYLESYEEMGANCWEYVGNIGFDNKVYFMYELQVPAGDSAYYGLMPMTRTIDELVGLSMYSDHSNRFQPFDYVLCNDEETVYQIPQHEGLPSDRYVLVKVEP